LSLENADKGQTQSLPLDKYTNKKEGSNLTQLTSGAGMLFYQLFWFMQ